MKQENSAKTKWPQNRFTKNRTDGQKRYKQSRKTTFYVALWPPTHKVKLITRTVGLKIELKAKACLLSKSVYLKEKMHMFNTV